MPALCEAPIFWQKRFRLDQLARRGVLEKQEQRDPPQVAARRDMRPLFEDEALAIADSAGGVRNPPVLTTWACDDTRSSTPTVLGQAGHLCLDSAASDGTDNRRGELVTDQRVFHMRACLYLGPVARMHLPPQTFIVGSAVSLLAVQNPGSLPAEQLRRAFEEEEKWKWALLLSLARKLPASLASSIFLWAREPEVDLARRLQPAALPGREDWYDPLGLDRADLLQTQKPPVMAQCHAADVDIALCQESEEEARAAALHIDREMTKHFGRLPKVQSAGTVTYFPPYPWRPVQLKLGRRPLLEWLLDADASPSACAMRPGGVLDLCSPDWCLPRALESLEYRVNILHERTLLHRPRACSRVLKYLGRGFLPLVVPEEAGRLWEGVKSMDAAWLRRAKWRTGRFWCPQWQVLHQALTSALYEWTVSQENGAEGELEFTLRAKEFWRGPPVRPGVLAPNSIERLLRELGGEEQNEHWDEDSQEDESAGSVREEERAGPVQHEDAGEPSEDERASQGEEAPEENRFSSLRQAMLTCLGAGASALGCAEGVDGSLELTGPTPTVTRLLQLFHGAKKLSGSRPDAWRDAAIGALLCIVMELPLMAARSYSFWETHLKRLRQHIPEDVTGDGQEDGWGYSGGEVLRIPGLRPETAACLYVKEGSQSLRRLERFEEALGDVVVEVRAARCLQETWERDGFVSGRAAQQSQVVLL